jgi:hypothetical protein
MTGKPSKCSPVRLTERTVRSGTGTERRPGRSRAVTKSTRARRLCTETQRSGPLGHEISERNPSTPGEAPATNHPAADAVVAEDVEEHVGEADGKTKRKRGKRKRGRGGQGAKSGPGRQQATPVAVQGRPSGAPRGNGQIQFPRNDNILTFIYLVSRGELKWTTDGLPPTEPGLHAGTNPLYKPPSAVRLGGTPDGLLNVLWTTVKDVSARHPPFIVAPALTTPSFWASSPPP